MSNLPENITLLGLVVNTIPFQFENNIVTATVSINVDIEQLEQMKSNIEADLEERKESIEDKERTVYTDDIYTLTKIIDSLKK